MKGSVPGAITEAVERRRRVGMRLVRLASGRPPAVALIVAWTAPARAVSLSARTDRLLDRLQQLGVVIDRLERCGPGAERAAYNRGVNRLCLADRLRDEPGLQLDVLTH